MASNTGEGGPADVNDLNPEFASRVAKFRAALQGEGINTRIVSGYRSPELQQKLYENYQARRAGQTIPHPEEGSGNIAAQPWQSYHNYGLAADILPDNMKDYPRMVALAKNFGITDIGPKDIDHFQMDGNLPALVQQYHLQGWRPGQNGAVAVNSGTAAAAVNAASPAASVAPPANTNAPWAPAVSNAAAMADLAAYAKYRGLNPLDLTKVMNQEGYNAWSQKNPNAQSNVIRKDGTRETSYGDFQLNTVAGGVGDAAKKAGIDVTDPSQRIQANRFAIDYIAQHGYGAWNSPYAKSLAAQGQWTTPATVGDAPALPTTAVASGTATPSPSGTATPTATTQPDQPKSTLEILTSKTGPQKNQPSPLEQMGSALGIPGFGGQKQMQQSQAPQMQFQAPPARNVGVLEGAGPSLMAQVQENAAKPLSWGSQPGQAGGMQAAGPTPGTTLNSMPQMPSTAGWGYYGSPMGFSSPMGFGGFV